MGEIFFWSSSVPLCVYVYMRIHIYSASRTGLFHDTVKSVVWIQQISQTCSTRFIYWKGRHYYAVITQCLHVGMFNLSHYVGYFQQLVKLSNHVLLITNVILSKHPVNPSKQQYFSLPLQQLNYTVLCKYSWIIL